MMLISVPFDILHSDYNKVIKMLPFVAMKSSVLMMMGANGRGILNWTNGIKQIEFVL